MLSNIVLEVFIIFFGSVIFGTILISLNLPMILGYIFWGMAVGPWGLKLIDNTKHLENISHIGIILLMFLLGLNLEPKKFIKKINETAPITLGAAVIFTIIFFGFSYIFKFPMMESLIIGIALLFSSTVIGIKLIPTSTLHHKHVGEVMISILLFQDIIAILVMLFLYGDISTNIFVGIAMLIVKVIGLVLASFIAVKYLVLKLMRKFDKVQEYIFVLSLAWCLLLAEVAHLMGLSYEIGAFLAGIMLAISPISLYIAEKLKHLREFFLVLFFFSIGAQLDLFVSWQVLLQSFGLALIIVFLKPIVYNKAFLIKKESESFSKEMGIRLGQASEFALFISFGAFSNNVIGKEAFYLIQLTTILTFIFSTYITSKNYEMKG